MAKHNPFLPNIPKPGVVDLSLFFLELCPLVWSRTSCKPAKQAIPSVLKYLLVSALSPLPSWGERSTYSPAAPFLFLLVFLIFSFFLITHIGPSPLYSFARAAFTKYHLLGGLTNKDLFPHSRGGKMSEIKVSAAGFLLRPLDGLVVGYLLPLSSCHLPSEHLPSERLNFLFL